MKKLLLALLLTALALPLAAQTAPTVAFDQFNNFEQCTNAAAPTSTCLSNSNSVATGTWSVTNPNTVITIQSASQGTEQGTAGTHGFQYSGNPSTQDDFIQYTLPSSQASITVSLYYKTGSCTVGFSECAHVVVFNNSGFGDLTRIADELDGVNNNRELRISPCNAGTTSCEVPVSDATGYWISFKYVQDGTTSLSVYTASYVLVGSATFAANINSPVTSVLFGNDLGALNASFTNAFDDIMFDWTNANYPALPNFATFVSQSGGSVSCGADGTRTTESAATYNGSQTAGTSYRPCGTVTTAMTVSANNETLQWESNTSLQVCSTSGALRLGSTSGTKVDLGGDALAIECPNNGTGLGTAVNAIGINAGNVAGTTIQNGTIGPLYQYTCCSSDGTSSVSVNLGAATGTRITGLALNNSNEGIAFTFTGNQTTTNNRIDHNTFASTVGRAIAYNNGDGTGADSNAQMDDNDIAFGDGWFSGAGDFTHIESIQSFNGGGSGTDSISNVQIYNNFFHGTSRGDSTSFIFIPDGLACPSTNSSWSGSIFNNVFQLGNATTSAPGDGFIFTQDCHHTIQIYNNTLDAGSNGHTVNMTCMEFEGTNTVTLKNNSCLNANTMIFNQASGITLTASNNDYFNFGTGQWSWQGVNKTTLAAWQTATGQDSGSFTTNPGLNPDFTITSTSSAVYQTGVNLTSLSIAALDVGAPLSFGQSGACGAGCVARSASVAWDMGAYPFASASPSAPAASAINLFARLSN